MTPEQVIFDSQKSAQHSGFLAVPEQREFEPFTAEIDGEIVSAAIGHMGRTSVEASQESLSKIVSIVEGEDENDGFDLDKEAPVTDSLTEYLNAIGKIDLLTAEEEVILSKQIEAGLMAKTVLRLQEDPEATLEYLRSDHEEQKRKPTEAEITKLQALAEKYAKEDEEPSGQEGEPKISNRMLLEEAVKEGEAAYKKMYESNLRLVVSLATRKRRQGYDLLDLIGHANMHGLPRAIEKFDYTKGYKFSTYATRWIRKSLDEAMAVDRIIPVSNDMQGKLSKKRRVEDRLTGKLGRLPTREEVAEEMDMDMEKFAEVERVDIKPSSLDAPTNGDRGEMAYGDLVSGNEDPASEVIDRILNESLPRDINAILDVLPEAQSEALRLRYGLDGDEPMAVKQVAEKLGITERAAAMRLLTGRKSLRARRERLMAYVED